MTAAAPVLGRVGPRRLRRVVTGTVTGEARRRWGAVVAAVVCIGSLSACTAARDTLGTNSSPCFRALALAKHAVHDRGTFTGVRLVKVSGLRTLPHLQATLEQRSSTRLHNVCLVSYRGTYTPDQVERPAGKTPPAGTGHIAIVVVSTPQNLLLATFVLQHEPVRFGHVALPAGRARNGPGPPPGSRSASA